MIEIQAKKIDEILHLITEQNSDTKYPRVYSDFIMLHLKMTKQEVIDLFNIIEDVKFSGSPIAIIEVQNIARTNDTYSIKATYNTEKFLSVGGCLEYYRDLIKDQQKQNELKELEKQKLINDIASFKITKKQYIITTCIAIAGFLIALGSLLLQIFNKPS